jgi:hypothetical protein
MRLLFEVFLDQSNAFRINSKISSYFMLLCEMFDLVKLV